MSDDLISILLLALMTVVPLYHVTSAAGFALQTQRIVMSVPSSLGMIRGFSTNDGGKPFSSSPPEKYEHFDYNTKHRPQFHAARKLKALHANATVCVHYKIKK